jgi:hypothetical protein
MIILSILLFFAIGLIECFVSSLNSKWRQNNKLFLVWISAKVFLIIWYFILKKFMQGEMTLLIFIFYMEGYSLGDVYGVKFANYLEKLAKKRGFKRKIRRIMRWGKK